ncbi:MAG: hypothetical protein ACI8ZN_001758 [Bacteroidia bacterium]|jgi:hypothetical protein
MKNPTTKKISGAIPNPCPVSIGSMKRCDSGYYCAGCEKVVVDFTEFGVQELKDVYQPGICGIFASNQLPNQSHYPGLKRLAFGLLTFASIVGFQVQPLKAQTSQKILTKDSVMVENILLDDLEQEEVEMNPEKRRNKRMLRTLFRRKHKYRVGKIMGCPSF